MGEKNRLIYDRHFVTRDSCEYNSMKIIGAWIEILFHFFDKDKKEIFFAENEECTVQEKLVCSIDENNGYVFQKKSLVGTNISSFTAKPVSFVLEALVGKGKDYIKDCPKELLNANVCQAIQVSEDEFKEFVKSNWTNFNVTENMNAICTGMSYELLKEIA